MKDWITKDRLNEVVKSIGDLTKTDILVGITERTSARDGEGPNNAVLGYVHEHGSPINNIPARPFLVPGVAESKNKYRQPLVKAAQFALDGDKKNALKQMGEAGIIAEVGAKEKIQTGPFIPLKPATIANRRKSRKTQSMRESEKQYLNLIKGGATPAEAQAAAEINPLINTGELRNSITHVIRESK